MLWHTRHDDVIADLKMIIIPVSYHSIPSPLITLLSFSRSILISAYNPMLQNNILSYLILSCPLVLYPSLLSSTLLPLPNFSTAWMVYFIILYINNSHHIFVQLCVCNVNYQNGCTALHTAASNGRVNVVKLLLEKEATVDIIDKVKTRGIGEEIQRKRKKSRQIMSDRCGIIKRKKGEKWRDYGRERKEEIENKTRDRKWERVEEEKRDSDREGERKGNRERDSDQ